MNDLDTSIALVSLEEARSYVYRSENDGSRDELLVEAINLVSSAIWTHCEREFVAAAGTPTRSFLLRDTIRGGARVGWIDLAPYDLRTASAVKLYTDQALASQQTLTTDEYRLRPTGGSLGGTYLEIITVAPTASEAQPGFEWEATVTGTWGMSSVPDDVRLACLQWVKNLAENPGSYASATVAGYTVAPEVDFAVSSRAGMPPAVRHRLQRYCRRP